jgi:hypothetical protein
MFRRAGERAKVVEVRRAGNGMTSGFVPREMEESLAARYTAKTPGLDRIHACKAEASRNVLEFIFHGMVAQ